MLLDASPKRNNGSGTTNTATSDSKDAGRSKYDEYKDNLRDFINNNISKLEPANAEEVYKALAKEHPDYCQMHMSLIQNLESNVGVKVQYPFLLRQELQKEGKAEDVNALEVSCQRIVELANLIMKGINLDDLLCYYGLKVDFRPDAAKQKAQMDKQKMLLIDAYVKKTVAMGKLGVIAAAHAQSEKQDTSSTTEATATLRKQMNVMYLECSKLTDMSDARVLQMNVWHSFINQHWGRFGKQLNKIYEEKQQKELLSELQAMFETELKWEHAARYLSKFMVTANPQAYRLF